MNAFVATCALMTLVHAAPPDAKPEPFNGKYFAGKGDVEYLQLLDTAYRMFYPDPELQNISMLYNPTWDGFVEGPTWGAWWIQNSYGPTFCALPFFVEPYTTFLQNAQDLWFHLMGNGERKGDRGYVAPDGCLCDAATPTTIYYRQGDGKVDIHDWGMEFTAAGVVMQAELLLISRDKTAITHYLPLLERCANFIETRRDPKNNLFLAGPAGNLLAPSYAACKKPDGTYERSYLTGLSITYIAGLDRLIELETMAGNSDKAALYTQRRDLARQGLPALMTDEGYFIKYMDQDGTKHGVYGAEKYGYFEAVCNHDAVALHVVDDAQSRRIYDKIASIPGLRPHDLIITNCPGLDDMYEPPTSWLWQFGTWVNGGHWTTCEARMMLAYYRVGAFEDARRSMKKILEFAREFRTDNPLVDFGAKVYQPKEPINITYDTWGAPAGLIRGLFEYLYTADTLRLIPHIPPGITQLDQRFPIRWGTKCVYLSTRGEGPISNVWINGKNVESFAGNAISLSYESLPDKAHVEIGLGGAPYDPPDASMKARLSGSAPAVTRAYPNGDPRWDIESFAALSASNTLPLRIGADSEGANGFIGDIRCVHLYNRALPDRDIAKLADEPASDHFSDLSVMTFEPVGLRDDGVFVNREPRNPAVKKIGDATLADSDQGKVLRLAGKGYAETKHDNALMLHDTFTLDAWICPKTMPAGGGRIVDKLKAGTDNGFLLDTCPGNSLRFITEMGTVSYDAKLKPDTWVRVAATADVSGELRLYIDGKLVASAPAKLAGKNLGARLQRLQKFCDALSAQGLGETYEAKHASLAVEYVNAVETRKDLRDKGKLPPLPDASLAAADRSYVEAAERLITGLEKVLASYEHSKEARKQQIFKIWK